MADFAMSDKIIVFGAGNRGRETTVFLLEHGIAPFCIFDNASNLWGSGIEGIKIAKPALVSDATVVIAIDRYYKEIHDQLVELGYQKDKIVVKEQIFISMMEGKNQDKLELFEAPIVIQLPITYACNFDCVMCGMSNLKNNPHITAEELGIILKDEYFSKVTTVGINGGEPFARKDLVECLIAVISSLHDLTDIYLISNGFFTEKMDDDLKKIFKLTSKHDVKLHLSLSLDGIGEIQDIHRGMRGSFAHIEETIRVLQRGVHFDVLNIICTITRHNIFNINEVVVWAENHMLTVEYDIAGENIRIDNLDKMREASIFSDEHARQMAQEFFYQLYCQSGEEHYFATYLYIRHKRRYGKCPCRNLEWITIYPNGQMGFCATRSSELGSLLEKSGKTILEEEKLVLERIADKYCNSCPQNMGDLTLEGKIKLYQDIVRERYMKI